MPSAATSGLSGSPAATAAAATRRERPSQLAYIGDDGQIFVRRFPSDTSHQLTWSWNVSQTAPARNAPGTAPVGSQPTTYAWPTWARDNRQLACFARQGEAGPASVYTVSADGVESWERARLDPGVPIYGNWSPDADLFAVLVQRGEELLSLETVCMARPGETTRLLSGAPLFWSWAPRGELLAVHVGGNTADGRVLLIEATAGKVVHEISDSPGGFHVPVWSPDGDLLTYVERHADGKQTLRLFDVHDGQSVAVDAANGMTAALWSPDGQALVYGSTRRAGSLLFPGLSLLDLASGRTQPFLEKPLAGFSWSPHATHVFYLSVDTRHSQLSWHRYDRTSGRSLELVRFLPSRAQTLRFSFFDQYDGSHPLLAPDGSRLAFSGHLLGPGAPRASDTPTVYTLSTTPPYTPEPVAAGNFACWNIPAGSRA